MAKLCDSYLTAKGSSEANLYGYSVVNLILVLYKWITSS